MPYELRYSFDAGSGICLWPDNDVAREKYDSVVDYWDLPISENAKRKLSYLIAWYDTCLDWNNPVGPSPWTKEEDKRFEKETEIFLETLRKELGDEFKIIDKRYK